VLIVVAIAKLKGNTKEFEALYNKYLEEVRMEPGCKGTTFGPTKSQDEYVFISRFRDQDALEAHRASSHAKEHGPAILAFFESTTVHVAFNELSPW
jgi:quinol monooxygenase YgiN